MASVRGARPAPKPTKMKLRKGDRVQVLAGKERGRSGNVMRIIPKTNKVIVDGINVAKRHQRQTQVRVKGGIIDKEMPMPASAVAIVCPKDGPTRVAYDVNAEGKKIRVCNKCREEL
jgi:large subunit ribosomal protein L24